MRSRVPYSKLSGGGKKEPSRPESPLSEGSPRRPKRSRRKRRRSLQPPASVQKDARDSRKSGETAGEHSREQGILGGGGHRAQDLRKPAISESLFNESKHPRSEQSKGESVN